MENIDSSAAQLPLSFEEAYEKLEELLETMNHSKISLEESLALYEKAALLISLCEKKLQEAEQKIEILLKQRDGSVTLGEEGEIKKEPFTPLKSSSLGTC